MNLAMLLDMVAEGLSDRVAVGSLADGLTYGDIKRLASAASVELTDSGAEVLAFVDANGPCVPVALFAAAWAGLSYAPINYRHPPAVLQSLVARLGSTAAVCGDEHREALAGANVGQITESADWMTRLGAAGDAGAGADTGFAEDPKRPAVLLFTSGTSAEPKAAVLEHEHLLAYILNAVEFASAGEDEAVLMAVPPFHIAGVAGMLSSIYAGRRIVPIPRFTPEDWVAAAIREDVTHAFVVPTMLARIVAVMEADPALRAPSVRSLAYGGARMPVPVLERALKLFPNAGFVNAYGLTETSSTVALLGPDDHRLALASDDPAVRARLGSVGKPLPAVEVEVVDDDGVAVPAGEEGRIRISGPQVAGAYLDVEDSSDGSGWLVTGDVGWVDAEGYLYVKGRADDVIIRGGENLSPGEIEDCLLRHDAVSSAAVVGVPDEEWGEVIAAMVTLRPGADVEGPALTEWVRSQIGSLKAPQTIEIRDELPMTPTGKILRREVRAAFSST